MPELVISVDGDVSQVMLIKQRTSVGRRMDRDVVLDRPTVSSKHAALHLDGGKVVIEDLGSTNGTWVNGVRVGKHTLEDNDFIEIGGCYILFVDRKESSPIGAGVEQGTSLPMAAEFAPTEPAAADVLRTPVLRVLSGRSKGKELPLHKVVTTLGTPGVAVAAVTRRRQGYVAYSVMGTVTLNGTLLDTEAVALRTHDVLQIDRDTRLAFIAPT